MNLATDLELQEHVLNNLRTNQQGVLVTFTKKDGSERKMQCTLVEGNIPADKRPKTETASQTAGSAVRVFDTEVSEWRSFRWDSVVKVEI
jgi:hypothetical protein